MVSYIPPENIVSKIQFITDIGISKVTGDQKTLTFRWDNFHDLSGIQSYSTRVFRNKTVFSDIQTPNKNYIRIQNVPMKNKEAYSVDVVGTNVGNISSIPKQASVRCEHDKPPLSGKVCEYNYVNKGAKDTSDAFNS